MARKRGEAAERLYVVGVPRCFFLSDYEVVILSRTEHEYWTANADLKQVHISQEFNGDTALAINTDIETKTMRTTYGVRSASAGPLWSWFRRQTRFAVLQL